MATWVEPIDTETDPDAPLTAQLGKRWDNNVIAAFDGEAGAPRLALKAIERLVAGDSVRSQKTSTLAPGGSFTIGFDFIQIGTIRCKSLIVSGSGSGSVSVTRFRNDGSTALYGAAAPLSGLDVSVIPGDRIEISTSSVSGGTYTASFSVASGSLWPGAQAILEGNDV